MSSKHSSNMLAVNIFLPFFTDLQSITNRSYSIYLYRLPSSLKGRLAGPTAAYDENERIHILMAITLARYISEQELTDDPKPIFSESICSKIREIITWPYFSSKVRPRGANPVPSNNAIRHIWYCLQTHGTARGTVVKSKRKKGLLPPARANNTTDFVRLPASLENITSNTQGAPPPNWPLYGRDFI